MKLLGKVNGLSKRGSLLVKGVSEPRDGEQVLDPTGRMIGKVERMVGPVSDPFIIVKLKRGVSGAGLPGIQVYTSDGSEKRWSKRRGKQRR